jgi:hypothetical protein
MRRPACGTTFRPTILTAALSLALGVASHAAVADESGSTAASAIPLPPYLHVHRAAADVKTPKNVPTTLAVVDHCEDDDAPGSLRSAIAAIPMAGGTVDLSGLVCSKITLDDTAHSPAFIKIYQDSLTIKGPGADKLTIDGNGKVGIFRHVGTQELSISDLTLANGKYASGSNARGGCLYSSGSLVTLDRVVVTHCEVKSMSDNHAYGGGVYTTGDLIIRDSRITDNKALAEVLNAYSGGAQAGGNVEVSGSTISGNSAVAAEGSGHYSCCGGLFAWGKGSVDGSTVSGNLADAAGGLDLDSGATITNSTISGNVVSGVSGNGLGAGVYSTVLTVANSTIAFNSDATGKSGGIFVRTSLTLQSSIVSDNGPIDIGGNAAATVTPDSSHNLIGASTVFFPAGTTQLGCPDLQPLADNGGPTRTHAPRQGSSLVLDQGGNPLMLQTDQRGLAREVGIGTDIGALERQPGEQDDDIFFAGFDGFCSH